MELILIRHALPVRQAVQSGTADPELSELGVRQATAMAEYLDPESIDALYSSPMRRARETAVLLAERRGLDVTVVDDIAEFDRDQVEYVPLEELRATKDPRYDKMIAGSYFDDFEQTPAEFQARVVAGIEGIIAQNPSCTAAVTCHGGVINAYVAHVLRTPEFMVFDPMYTGITRLRASSLGHRSVVTVNEFAHLRGL